MYSYFIDILLQVLKPENEFITSESYIMTRINEVYMEKILVHVFLSPFAPYQTLGASTPLLGNNHNNILIHMYIEMIIQVDSFVPMEGLWLILRKNRWHTIQKHVVLSRNICMFRGLQLFQPKGVYRVSVIKRSILIDFFLSFRFIRFYKVKYLNFYEWALQIPWHSQWRQSDNTKLLFCAIFNNFA